ncbi:MAG: ribosomal-processing cysteine protease Prp [Lachnospiraceae bacterium]|nr:ribosomal-processing cysteine protease Prp [Lachnospiraceae bacterium]
MTNIIIKKTENGDFAGFTCEGHTDFKSAGEDIVCAAVSVLTINTINSLDILVKEPMEVKKNEGKGFISVTFIQTPTKMSCLLMDSYILGISEILSHYGKKYVQLEFEEI